MNMVAAPKNDRAEGDAVGSELDRPVGVGGDERRMHVRAYNYWVSLLKGRAYPSIEDMEPASIADFGANSVLFDFSTGVQDPAIEYLGDTLRDECGVDSGIHRVSQVPQRSLLSRLTDHYLQIIHNRAPTGFEAEFLGQHGHNTLYRGILLPFSRDGKKIDHIYGVINWKVTVDDAMQASLAAEIEAVRRDMPHGQVDLPAAWADGPSSGFNDNALDIADMAGLDEGPVSGLDDLMAHARAHAADALRAEERARAALQRALDQTYALLRAADADEADFARLLSDADIKDMDQVSAAVDLVFGNEDSARRRELVAVLRHAHDQDISVADFPSFVRNTSDGIVGASRMIDKG